MVQWLRLCDPNAMDPDLISDQGTVDELHLRVSMLRLKIPQATTKRKKKPQRSCIPNLKKKKILHDATNLVWLNYIYTHTYI